MADKQYKYIQTQVRKGLLDYIILLLMKKKSEYPREMINRLQNKGFDIVEGTIYPLLSRLKKQELINYEWVESDSGHPRKYYSLTKEGKNYLKIYKSEWETITHIINQLS